MEGFAEVMAEVVENIDDIAWLDLSFNELEGVSKVRTTLVPRLVLLFLSA